MVDLPAPWPPTRTLRLGFSEMLAPSRKPPSHARLHQLGVRLGLRFAVLAIEADARIRVQKRLPQALDAHLGHLDAAGGGGVFEVRGGRNLLGVDHGHRLFVARGMDAPVVRVPVLKDAARVFRKLLDGSGNANGEQVFAAPCLRRQVGSGRRMRGNRDATLEANPRQHVLERRACLAGGRHRRVHSELAEKPFELFLVRIRRVDAEDVNTLG